MAGAGQAVRARPAKEGYTAVRATVLLLPKEQNKSFEIDLKQQLLQSARQGALKDRTFRKVRSLKSGPLTHRMRLLNVLNGLPTSLPNGLAEWLGRMAYRMAHQSGCNGIYSLISH